MAIKSRPMMCYKEATKMPPMPLVGRTVTSDRFQMFEVSVRKRRRLWLWSASTTEGEVIVKGTASTRSAAVAAAPKLAATRKEIDLPACSSSPGIGVRWGENRWASFESELSLNSAAAFFVLRYLRLHHADEYRAACSVQLNWP